MIETQPPQFQSGIDALREGRLADAEALFGACLDRHPDHPAALYNLGIIYFQTGKSVDAEGCLRKALKVRPDHTDTQALLAGVLVEQNKLTEAVPLARGLANAEASDASALNTAGQVLALAGWSDEAELAYEKALSQDPGYRHAGLALINLLMARRSNKKAIDVCNAVLTQHPMDQDLHLKRSQAYWDDGQVSRARGALLDLLDFAPDHITAHHNASLFADLEDPESSIRRLSVHVTEGDLAAEDLAKAWFALGNLYASVADPEAAMACFQDANEARQVLATPAHALSTDAFEKRVESLLATPIPPFDPRECDGPTPVIISGPSRSGKSLLQNWLCGHPEISGADETGVLPRLAEEDVMSDPVRLSDAAATYRAALSRLGGEARFVIDTHPVNTLYLDLLHAMCPDAVVIQMERDPLDLAVSIYARNYVTGGHWANTWQGIAARLGAYQRLHAYWSAWGGVKASVPYETLVGDPNGTLRTIIQALGLTWSESVLPPTPDGTESENPKPMPWASFPDRSQVSGDAIGLWTPYAPWLSEFADTYRREKLVGADAIPTVGVQPQCALTQASHLLCKDKPDLCRVPEDLHALPSVQAYLAEQAEQDGLWGDALHARWAAANYRPFTYRTRHHTEALQATLRNSPGHAELAGFHNEIDHVWQTYKESANLRFGDFGLSYQSCEPLFIVGSRDTERRCGAYDGDQLVQGQRVLDLGCNSGFLALRLAQSAAEVVGVESEAPLIEMARRSGKFLNSSNCTFVVGDAAQFQSDRPFDVVVAAAVHGWINTPFEDFADQLSGLTASNGVVLLESQGRRSTVLIEEGFPEKAALMAAKGFAAEREGTVCDDGVNLRAFVILRKQS